jgi:hypothetical protein
VKKLMPTIAIATLLSLAALVAVRGQLVQLNVVWNTLPGEFAIQTVARLTFVSAIPRFEPPGDSYSDFYVTTDQDGIPLNVSWQKFRLAQRSPPSPQDKSIQTYYGRYLTAVDGGGRTSDTIHADAKEVKAWEQFQLIEVLDFPQWFAIQTIHGNYLTAVGGGGVGYPGEPFHTDATQIKDWERFRLLKCGDLGSGYQYTLIPGAGYAEPFLYAANGGGLADLGNLDTVRLEFTAHADNVWLLGWPKFKFIRQSDGSYALQTSNGVNYVTALGGGGKVETITKIFHTDATQVQAWERFKFIDQGNCWYYMQTVSGKYVGVTWDHNIPLLTTDRDEGQYFELIPRDLNYHPEPAPAGPPRPHSYGGVKAA